MSWHDYILFDGIKQFTYIGFMAFDGSVIAGLTKEDRDEILGGRILKIAQTEKNELLFTIKKDGDQKRLLMSADASLPITYLTEENKAAPLQAPAFCMLLRKHIQNGVITSITQPTMERIIDFEIEHYNEMGDLCTKILTLELMGKHSNIIFREDARIIDSIKHINALVSSVREVLPGREYFIPFEGEKNNPFSVSLEGLTQFCDSSAPLSKALYTSLTGVSPLLAEEICFRACIDSDRPAQSLTGEELNLVTDSLLSVMNSIANGEFSPVIYFDNKSPVAYSALDLSIYKDLTAEHYPCMSAVLIDYYSKKKQQTEIRQKTAGLRQIVQTILSKDYKKYDLQQKQIKDTEKREKYKLYGELITAYGYSVPEGSVSMTAEDYHTGEEIQISLDPTISVIDNGKKYFEKYAKQKRTYEALNEIILQTKEEIDHLETILASLDMIEDEADIADLKKEMADSGYIRKTTEKKGQSKKAEKSSPLHFVTSGGLDVYVGKNNFQNEYLTLKFADGEDWWFHAKQLPGSHVILRSSGKEVSDRDFEEAASLAAHFSKAEGAQKVEVDYVQRKQIKKPSGSKPGYVIYHTNYSMSASTDISAIKEV